MKYRIVIQWPASSIGDYVRTIEVESALMDALSEGSEVDGHDAGSGEMNIFVHTDNVQDVFAEIKGLLAARRPEQQGQYGRIQARCKRSSWRLRGMPMTRLQLLLVVFVALAPAGVSKSFATDSTGARIPAIERKNERQPLYVSFARLAANPERYRGKDIQLAGYLSAAFEDIAVYATHDAYRYGVRTDSVRLMLDEQEFAIARKLHGRFVLVRGVLSDVGGYDGYSAIGTMRALIRLREIEAAP